MSSFRPIAPAPHMDIYAAACNPPRRAKRPRAHSDASSSPSPSPSPSPPDVEETRRRGRRPGTLSRAAREAQRKINHSLIEKARRTKINDALATLRVLVPPEYKRPSDHPDDEDDEDEDDPKKPRQKPKPSGEKEFKLEILVRTVAYLQDLTDRVHQLEHSGCPRCSEPIAIAPTSRKRPNDDRATSRSSSAAPHSRLPSISTWLPSAADDQAQSPQITRTQLPTPPSSATCPPTTSGFAMPPVLTLPSPSTLLPSTSAHMLPRFSGFTSRPPRSPLSSPIYTPEDETAASLLLRMSNTSPRTSSHPAEPVLGTEYALTPSRLLGLNASR